MNGVPLELLQPSILRYKLFEPILLLGKDKYKDIDIRIRVRGGGQVSQLYAIRQAVAKSIVAYYQKCMCNMLLLLLPDDYDDRDGSLTTFSTRYP